MSTLLISEAFELYRTDYIVMSHQSLKTEEAYHNASILLVRFLGDIRITDIDFQKVRDWHLWMMGWQKPDTARGNIICLRMVLKFLLRRNEQVLNYESIPVASRQKRTVKYLTDEEVQGFIEEAGRPIRGYPKTLRKRNVAIITLLYATGLRNGELCALNRDSIKNRQFTVAGKSKNPRICFINSAAEKAIEEYLAIRDDNSPALFISHQTGNRLTTHSLQETFRNICNRSDFEDVHPHTIRHSFGTNMLEKRVDLRYIGDLMGHVDLNTTKMYTHYSNPQLREVYEKAWSSISVLTYT